MIKMLKDKPAPSLETRLEKLYQMRSAVKFSNSQISNEYSLNILDAKIAELEKEIEEKEVTSTIKDEEVFDTEVYAKRAKENI